jgi:hypothetical protein
MKAMSNRVDLDAALDLSKLKAGLPARPAILEIRHAPYVDALGANELMIQVILANDTRDEDFTSANLQAIRNAVVQAVRDDDRFPYIRFLTEAELVDTDED